MANENKRRIGVFICHCGINIARTVDVEEVAEFAATLPDVVVSRHYQYVCSDPGQGLIKKDIADEKLDRIVIASCSPRMHEATFGATISDKGLSPYCLEMANIREQCSWVHTDKGKATAKAKSLVAAAVNRASLLEPLEVRRVEVKPAALVLGGGIAGIQASLDIADAGFDVFLVERNPSIGGHMAQLDKTFPTLDCSACILTPKMVEVGRHRNIELMTYAEVISVDGYVGNFDVKVKKKPRYIDLAKCIGCGECASACRLEGKVPNEFDVGLSKRSVPYVPFPQAVPLKYTIDPEHCLYLKTCKCGKGPLCVEACSADAIDLEQRAEVVELKVGTIIVATGYDEFDATLKPEYGYDRYPEVITGLECERLCSASGPTGGEIVVNGKRPKDIVFIKCVGSRDQQVGNEYCSRVCCMYTAKQAHLLKEKIPEANITVCYTDVRAFGKGYEEFYDRVRGEGVLYRRGNVGEVFKRKDRLIVRGEDTLLGEVYEDAVDLVVLATGLAQRKDAKELGTLLRISQGPDRFFLEAHPKLRPVDTSTKGIFLAGCAQAPKDIPDTVAQAKAAASSAVILMEKGAVDLEPLTPVIIEELCSGCTMCIELCPYGALDLDVDKKVTVVNAALCEGCGACGSACPSGAISMRHFTNEQISAQVTGLAATQEAKRKKQD